MADAYGNVMGGALKLKGGKSLSLKLKKSKKKKRKRDRSEREADDDREDVAAAAATSSSAGGADAGAGAGAGAGEGASAPPTTTAEAGASGAAALVGKVEEVDFRTPAQRRFDEVRLKREQEEAVRAAKKSHRQKVEELNAYLSKLPVHNDVPKVASAGNG